MAGRNSEAICPLCRRVPSPPSFGPTTSFECDTFHVAPFPRLLPPKIRIEFGRLYRDGPSNSGSATAGKTRVKGNNSRNFRRRSDLWIVSAPGARDRWSSGGPAEETQIEFFRFSGCNFVLFGYQRAGIRIPAWGRGKST
jgi:hypothetical protein